MLDFHCHIDLYSNAQEILDQCREAGIYVLAVTTTPSAWQGSFNLVKDYSKIRLGLGIHPQIAHERRQELDLFRVLVHKTKYVGEIGLDGSGEYSKYWKEQKEVFKSILNVCRDAGGRIASIHSRRAASAVLDELANHPEAVIPVLHWFSGSQEELKRAIEHGCWFSVGPAMLQGNRGKELCRRMPRERVLTETDGPFARIHNRPLRPVDVQIAISELAGLWGVGRDAASEMVDDNFKRLCTMLPPQETTPGTI